MRGQKTWSLRFISVLGVALAVGVLLALWSAAASAKVQPGPGAPPEGPPALRSFEGDKLLPSAGVVVDFKETILPGFLRLFLDADLGPAAFSFSETGRETDAMDEVLSSRDGSDFSVLTQSPSPDLTDPKSPRGGISRIEELMAYRKRSDEATLSITIEDAILRAIDDRRDPGGCSPKTVSDCPLLRGVVRFRARAYAASAGDASGGDFFAEGGVAYLEGYRGHWTVNAVTDADSQTPLWDRSSFTKGTGCRACLPPHPGGPGNAAAKLRAPLTLAVPLDSLRHHELFAVDVTLESEATNDRGSESTSLASIADPEHFAPGLLKTRGLQPLGKPHFREPKPTPPPAASCPAGPSPRAGRLQLSSSAYAIGEADGFPTVLVTRSGGSRGQISATVRTSGGAAKSGQDFKATTTRVTFANGDTSPRFVEIPIREDQAVESPEDFSVSLSHPRCGALGKPRHASVTILDDDQPPPPPPPTFTIGGTVDGLQGSGLVLTNLGPDVPVSTNGVFTFPGTASTGQPYEVAVRTQPTNPDQVCTVQNGKGTVGIANVTDIAVHCTTSVFPSGLDSTFGDHGRVTIPGNGEGRAVLIQPDGKIVTVGPREVGVNFHFQFGATRHDADGNLDPSFGTGGIATTPLGGNDDKARDAALLPDGGFVAVGQADPAGLANVDFGVVRYTPDGQPDPSFNGTGIETTDIAGRGDVANAVAVQPDGKIVVAGEAETAPGFFDFAVVRYNTNGTLDSSFDGDGIVITDLGSEFDDATAVAIQPDGKIVVAGDTDQNVALARYLPNGKPDLTFNAGGTVVSNIGTNEANGVAITPGGTILIAGTRVGPKGDRDPFVASYGPSGKLNLGFGNFGVAQADLSGQDDFGNDLTLDANGNIVVVGSAASATVSDMALVRFKPDGTLDTTLTTDFHGTGDFGNALAIDPQGRIVVAGTSGDQFALMRARF